MFLIYTMQDMFSVAANAEEALRQLAAEAEDNGKALTILSSGAGCGGPALKVALRPPLPDDLEVTAGGFLFRVRKNIEDFIKGAVIETKETFWGTSLTVTTTYRCL